MIVPATMCPSESKEANSPNAPNTKVAFETFLHGGSSFGQLRRSLLIASFAKKRMQGWGCAEVLLVGLELVGHTGLHDHDIAEVGYFWHCSTKTTSKVRIGS